MHVQGTSSASCIILLWQIGYISLMSTGVVSCWCSPMLQALPATIIIFHALIVCNFSFHFKLSNFNCDKNLRSRWTHYYYYKATTSPYLFCLCCGCFCLFVHLVAQFLSQLQILNWSFRCNLTYWCCLTGRASWDSWNNWSWFNGTKWETRKQAGSWRCQVWWGILFVR